MKAGRRGQQGENKTTTGAKTREQHNTPMSTDQHKTTRCPHDTDQVALIVIVPVEFVRFLCHLEARQSGLIRHEIHTNKRTRASGER